ncbi:MAG: NADH-quinone oxidoreductase subunit L [Caldilineaceae bacterium SB0675_bin_29]|uniref:NADH-quinone oxidoreductase subunit L n=1 Tax=Caldilineaceae bacterium SB0675_bin_29 TaxID=2605266 RepID=A0A6B1FX94_9CHLR|nr:NADH-quinone oxidoreductase subunit L [Caldilineaceae bacterium SB0675_bin_29]
MLDLAWLILVFPALGALINLFVGDRLKERGIHFVASGAVVLSFVVSLGLFFGLSGLDEHHRTATVHLWDWITIGSFRAPAALLIDPLSVTMALIVTGVGALIHIYAGGYMHGEQNYQRFFVYLNFFILAMLVLILSNNFVGMFVGWEGVGLASYLLIGFYFDRHDESYGHYADAGKKAFLVNRIGDFGMMLAVFLIWTGVGSVVFEEVSQGSGALATGTATAICLLLLLAATGKSAQLPLFVWLPDAMAGPTPVSALIHAATMVTAGIYMVARTHFLWDLAPIAGSLAAWVGGLTALLAATIALTQVDLKKILAYSTISQLGYMMLGVGVGAYAFAIFHLVTHAFFKALLFLAAGNVMHGLPDGELDIRKMGNLRAKMPTTYILFVIGALALAGFPALSGFFSKDGILLHVANHNILLYLVGLFTALLTAFYSFRAVFMAFCGEARDQHIHEHAHESPAVMTRPLWVLAILAVIGGALNLPMVLTMEHYLEASVGKPAFHPSMPMELVLLAVSAVVALAGVGLAYGRYLKSSNSSVGRLSAGITGLVRPLEPIARNRWYVDEIYAAWIVGPLLGLSKWFTHVVDQGVVDGAVNLVGHANLFLGGALRKVHNGLVPTYALSLFCGVVALLLWFVIGG